MSVDNSESVSVKRRLNEQSPDRKLRKLDVIHMFGDTDVAVIVDNEENIWFRAIDIATALEMKDPSSSVNKNVHKEYCKNYEELALLNEKYNHIPDIHPKTTFINEAGMNAFIVTSRKPKSFAFINWVFCEVLPSIRKTNKYEIDPNDNPYRYLNEQIETLLIKNKELESENAAVKTKNLELKSENVIVKTENLAVKTENEVVTTQNNRMKLDIELCVKKLFSMRAQNVPILDDPGKSEYLIVYRKHKIDDEWTEDLPYYACRVQRKAENRARMALLEKYENLEEVARFSVPNSVNFFNNMKEDLKQFIVWRCNSFKLRDVSEAGMKAILDDFHEKRYGNSKAQVFLDTLLKDYEIKPCDVSV